MKYDHDHWMRAALRQAEIARQNGETPIGAVIVCNDKIIGRGRNLRENRQDVTLHAEMIAIRQACRRLGSWRLLDCTLYVTLEPCIMCAGAIVQARIRQVVFGATDLKAGACGSLTNIFILPQNHQVMTVSGILATECSAILKKFFVERREADKAIGSRGVRKIQAIKQNQDARNPD